METTFLYFIHLYNNEREKPTKLPVKTT